MKEKKEEKEGFITCEDCKFYDPSINLDTWFTCTRFGTIFPDEEGWKVPCSEFEKKQDVISRGLKDGLFNLGSAGMIASSDVQYTLARLFQEYYKND